MKKIILLTALIIGFLAAHGVQAAGTIKIAETPAFKVETKAINRISGTNKTRFDFNTIQSLPLKVSQWKLRVWCDKGAQVSFGKAVENVCGKVVAVPVTAVTNFSLVMAKTNTQGSSGFSFKLKGYDKNGKWVESADKAFRL